MNATLSKPVGSLRGKEHGNAQADVLRVQKLLAAARCQPSVKPTGVCDGGTIAAIKDFQEAVGVSQTGRLASQDAVVTKLVALVEGPHLHPIKQQKISHGGFTFKLFQNVVPKNKYTIYLSFRNRSYAAGQDLQRAGELPFLIDATGRPHSHLVGPDQLAAVLKQIELIDGTGAWGRLAHCAVYVARDQVVVSRTNGTVSFDCPVKPYPGPIGDASVPSKLDVAEVDPEGPWTYTENGLRKKSGSMLHDWAFNGKYFFKYAGLFTIKNKLRGFDCTTYPGSIFGLPSTSMGSYDAICDGMMARPVGVEKAGLTAFLKFMEAHTSGAYLVYIGTHHIVIISEGVCYEFNVGPNGRKPYSWDPFMKRQWSPTDHYTVRELGAVVTDAPISSAASSTA